MIVRPKGLHRIQFVEVGDKADKCEKAMSTPLGLLSQRVITLNPLFTKQIGTFCTLPVTLSLGWGRWPGIDEGTAHVYRPHHPT